MTTVHQNDQAEHPTRAYSIKTDAELAALACNNSTAFAELYDRYFNRVYYYLLDLTKNVVDAEDLTSQTFISAFSSIKKLRQKDRFSSWLFRIARNKANDFFRKQKSRQEIPTEFIEDLNAEAVSNPTFSKEDVLMVRHLMGFLSSKDSELLRLRFVAELSFQEIADTIGESVNKVKKNYYKIIKMISTELKD